MRAAWLPPIAATVSVAVPFPSFELRNGTAAELPPNQTIVEFVPAVKQTLRRFAPLSTRHCTLVMTEK
jgi:hypothetical protein